MRASLARPLLLAAAACTLAVEAAFSSRQVPPPPAVAPAAAPVAAPVAAPAAAPSGSEAVAYGLLRASSQRMGGVAGEVANLKAGLGAVQKELAGEYDSWKARRKIHVEERNLLLAEVKRLQAYLNGRKALREEKASLQSQLLRAADKFQSAAMAHRRVQQSWDAERSVLQQEVDHLTGQVQANRTRYAVRLAEQENASAALRNESGRLKEDVHLLDLHLQEFRNLTARRRANATSGQVQLLQQAQALQKQIGELQAGMKAQAAVRAQIDAEHRRLASQGSEELAQRQKLREALASCRSELGGLDGKLGAVKRSFSESKAEYLACQALEGEKQKLQEQLNMCRAGQKAGN